MKLSIILLYYNQEKYMEKLFKSIKYANIKCEIIVIDDYSKQLFPFEKVKKIIPNTEIKLIRNKYNTKNQSYCRNLGIKHTTVAFNPSIMYTNYYTANIIKSLNSNSLQKYINKNYIKYIKEMCLDIVI